MVKFNQSFIIVPHAMSFSRGSEKFKVEFWISTNISDFPNTPQELFLLNSINVLINLTSIKPY